MDPVRKRVQRNQIPHEKDLAGRVWIILDEAETLQDESPDNAGQGADPRSELVDELRDRIRYLERQVEEEREARQRADTILGQPSQANAEQARTIRALEPPAPPESPEPREEPDRPLVRPERVQPEKAEPVEPEREEPERAAEMPMGPIPSEASDGSQTATEHPFTEEEPERKGL